MPKMTGAQYLAESMKGYGVSHIFFVPTILSTMLAEMDKRKMGITRVLTHGEKAAAYMADGYARASGRPGICMSQIVGGVNLAAGLRDAWLSCTPLIAFSGGTTPQERYRNAYQEVEDISAFDPVTKFNACVDSVDRIPDLLRQAFRAATSGTPGPVHLRFAGNLGQIEEQELDSEILVEEQFSRVPPFRPEPEASHIAQAADILGAAKKPVIISGGGVRTSGAGAEIVELAEKLQIPIANSMNGKDTVPGNHPLALGSSGSYPRRSANQLVREADLVFFVGTQTGGMVTHFWSVPPIGTPAIQLDIDPEELGRNYPLKAAIMGDAKVSLRKLIDAVDPSTNAIRKEWVEHCQSVVSEWREEWAPLLNSDNAPIRPERICQTFSDFLPSDAIVVADTGHSGMWTGGYLDLNSPDQSYMRAAGHLGWGFPASLGAKCGAPDRPVVLFTGDAGFWYHLSEIETAVRRGINTIVMVNNNGAQNQEEKIFDKAYGGKQPESGHELWYFQKTNFKTIAESMGAHAIRVEKPSELQGALEQALAIKDGPVVLDVVTDIHAMAPRP
ncbi:MAG: thiamine pyrophosphate-binding protein [Nitrospinaceae bacterium]|jgi:acetolactate synthase I/II/III large subunit|nr:thiamine pyrophosphate-binding protein [Nitrospinaceae bacterium]MBT3434325.1 thiamine pyrophosphate-binding protein [Nitrospinaceae bacterium]MBT3820087.1 thiamine pyrophosphate-binding protein [Nitrospinaceae bacterium]MBT4094978.1 thiamine pyrophosphate-binding protein [Nitrospinaceae bacterium]MBT4432249.1 thiamine pyrophosphate-binding protein [Nitrospinaceae bacterium]